MRAINMNTTNSLMESMAREYVSLLLRAIREKDSRFLRAQGLSEKELSELGNLAELSDEQCDRFLADGKQFIKITLNKQRYVNCLKAAKRQVENDGLIYSLLRADAPNRLFKDHFGLRGEDVANLRRKTQIKSMTQTKLSDDEINKVFREYERLSIKFTNDPLAIPKTALELNRKTNIGIRRFYRDVFTDREAFYGY